MPGIPISMTFRIAALRLAVAGLTMLGLGACSSLPTREHAMPDLPAGFSQPGSAPVTEAWWRGFQDTQLDQLIAHALQHNFSLRAVWDRLDQAAALARKSRAGYFPQLDASAAAGRTSVHNGTENSEYSAGLSAAYEVDLWGRVRSSAQAADLDRQASAAQLQTAALTLSAQIASAWYQFAEQSALAELQQRQLDTNRQVLELVTLRFQHGQVGATDVLQQRQLVESTRGDLALTQAQRQVLRHQLAVLLGEAPGTSLIPEPAPGLQVQLPELPGTGVPAQRLQQRPDVQQRWLTLQAADRRVAAALAERFPRLSLSGTATASASRSADLFDDWIGNLAANLLLPVIDGGQRRAEVQRTEAVASEALNEYRQTLLDAFGEVEDALTREQRQQEYLASVDQQLRLSRLAIERLRDSYRNGAVDYLRVLNALLTDQSLERSRLQARRQWIEYRIALHRALAGGWTPVRPGAAMAEGS